MPRRLGGMHGVDHVLGHVVALRVHPLDELRREVQPRRGCRRRVLLVHGVDRLVLLGVALVLGDVGRKRHMPCLVDGGIERAATLRLEAHQPAAAVVLEKVNYLACEHDLGREGRVQAARAVLDDGARLAEALPGVHETLPHMAQGVEILSALEQERLGHAAGSTLVAHEARRHDARLVGNEKVAGVEVVNHVGEVAVLERAVLTVEHEKAAGVARLRGCLCDELVWERVVKVVGAHMCGSPRALGLMW